MESINLSVSPSGPVIIGTSCLVLFRSRPFKLKNTFGVGVCDVAIYFLRANAFIIAIMAKLNAQLIGWMERLCVGQKASNLDDALKMCASRHKMHIDLNTHLWNKLARMDICVRVASQIFSFEKFTQFCEFVCSAWTQNVLQRRRHTDCRDDFNSRDKTK